MAAPVVMVLRPRAQAQDWVERLAAAGVLARALPLIEIEPPPDPAAVRTAVAALSLAAAAGEEPVAVFVSPNAVAAWFDAARSMTPACDAWPAAACALAAGAGTTAALQAAGVPAAAIAAPPPSGPVVDSEALWSVVGSWRWAGRPVWIARGNGGREWLAQRLDEAGARLRIVQVYARAAPRLSEEEQALLAAAGAEPAGWCWLFSSSETVDRLLELAPHAPWRDALALATHPRIARHARSAGFGQVELIAPDVQAVADAVRGRVRDP